MAMTNAELALPWAPLPADAIWPSVRPGDVSLYYYPPADILYVHLLGAPRPGIVWPVEPMDAPFDGLSVKIDEASNAVVDVLVEGYLARAVRVRPAWLALARFAGVSNEALADAGVERLVESGECADAVTVFLQDVRAAWDAAAHDEVGQAHLRG